MLDGPSETMQAKQKFGIRDEQETPTLGGNGFEARIGEPRPVQAGNG